jgi:tetratricopeptide (TPR) repeat protein
MNKIKKTLSIFWFIGFCSAGIYGQSVDSLLTEANQKCINNPDSSIILYNQALSIQPENEELITAKVNCLLSSKQPEKALFYINSKLDSDTTNATYYYIRGKINENLSFSDTNFLTDYKRAIEINPNHVDALYNTSVYYYNCGVNVTNQISIDTINSDSLLSKKTFYFTQSLKYMENVYYLEPEDEYIQQGLIRLYTILGLENKKKEFEQEIEKNSR